MFSEESLRPKSVVFLDRAHHVATGDVCAQFGERTCHGPSRDPFDAAHASVYRSYVGRRETAIRRPLDRWARDDGFWVRRSSLLAELTPLKNGAPFEPFARRADDAR
jgi:hypothetical protein